MQNPRDAYLINISYGASNYYPAFLLTVAAAIKLLCSVRVALRAL